MDLPFQFDCAIRYNKVQRKERLLRVAMQSIFSALQLGAASIRALVSPEPQAFQRE